MIYQTSDILRTSSFDRFRGSRRQGAEPVEGGQFVSRFSRVRIFRDPVGQPSLRTGLERVSLCRSVRNSFRDASPRPATLLFDSLSPPSTAPP